MDEGAAAGVLGCDEDHSEAGSHPAKHPVNGDAPAPITNPGVIGQANLAGERPEV